MRTETVSIPRIFIATLKHFSIKRPRLLGLTILGIASSALAAVVPSLLGKLVDQIDATINGNDSPGQALIVVFLLLAAGMVVRDGLRIWYGFEVTKLTNELTVRARQGISRRALTLRGGAEVNRTECTYMLNSDVPQLGSLYSQPLTTVVSDVLDTVFVSIAIATMSLALIGIVAAPLIPIFLVATWAGVKQRQFATDIREQESTSGQLLDRALRNSLIVRIFGGRGREISGLEARHRNLAKSMGSSNRNLATLMLLVSFLRLLAMTVAIWYAVLAVKRGDIPVGNIAALMMYLTRYYSPAINLSKAYQGIQRGAISTRRIIHFLEQTRLNKEDESCHPTTSPVRLELRDVALKFADGREFNIPDFSISNSGLVLIRGESGVGKSTLLRAIIGVESNNVAGTIDISALDKPHNDSAVGEFSRFSYFSFAGQDNDLIGDSVLGCVTYPAESADDTQGDSLSCLRRLGVEALAGREIAGELIPLSGGEARRVVLARALHRKAPILIADEVTSNLDEESRTLVEQALIEESQNRIVILTTHNPSPELIAQATTTITLE